MVIQQSTGRRGFIGLTVIVGLAVWFARGSSDCKQAAQPLIDALERHHKVHGRYPVSLDDLVGENLIRAIPQTTWNFGVRHPFGFEYFVDPDLDFFCLGYAEYELHFDDDGRQVSYVSFRGCWDDAPGLQETDLWRLPVERAGECFRVSRSSAALRLLVKKVIGSAPKGCSIFWEDVAEAIGSVSQCAIEGQSGLCVEAGDNEATAFFLVTRRAHTLRGNSDLLIKILERNKGDTILRWREVLHDRNEWEWLSEDQHPFHHSLISSRSRWFPRWSCSAMAFGARGAGIGANLRTQWRMEP
nr:hypothetical protein [Singulisphaera sp. GP187]